MSDEAITDGGHTPGPWTFTENSWAETTIYGGGRPIATLSIENDCDEDTQDEWEAKQREDARLISAAPDLYEALKTLHGYVVQAWPSLSDFPSVKAAAAALAKAHPPQAGGGGE